MSAEMSILVSVLAAGSGGVVGLLPPPPPPPQPNKKRVRNSEINIFIVLFMGIPLRYPCSLRMMFTCVFLSSRLHKSNISL
ncbi:hypothetical protein D3C80_1891120 [compost metagenome]